MDIHCGFVILQRRQFRLSKYERGAMSVFGEGYYWAPSQSIVIYYNLATIGAGKTMPRRKHKTEYVTEPQDMRTCLVCNKLFMTTRGIRTCPSCKHDQNQLGGGTSGFIWVGAPNGRAVKVRV